MIIYTYKYLWKMKDNKPEICIKIYTDTDQGHSMFINGLKKELGVENLAGFTREYLNEYDCDKIGTFEALIEPDVEAMKVTLTGSGTGEEVPS